MFFIRGWALGNATALGREANHTYFLPLVAELNLCLLKHRYLLICPPDGLAMDLLRPTVSVQSLVN